MIIIDYNEVYERISNGKPYDKKLKPYSELVLIRLLNILESEDEFEKCQVVKKHLDNMNHELGFKCDFKNS